MAKNPSIDALKGALILLVMLGHMAELVQANHIALWIGSGFRMPLMVGISGYLLNLDRVRANSFGQLVGHYRTRMLQPWLFATLIYILISGWPLSGTMPIAIVLRPPFHLWYIPVLCLLILTARLIPLSPLKLLALGAPISLLTMYAFGLGHGPIGDSLLSPDSRFLRYPLYFFLGMALAGRPVSPPYFWMSLGLAGSGMAWWAGLFNGDGAVAILSARLLMNIGLIGLLPFASAVSFHFAPLNALGRYSLFFYLWHPLAIGVALAAGLAPIMAFIAALIMLILARHMVATMPLMAAWTGAGPIRQAQAAPAKADALASA